MGRPQQNYQLASGSRSYGTRFAAEKGIMEDQIRSNYGASY